MPKLIEATPTERMHDAVEEAKLAFWAVIADRFPEAESGDMSVEGVVDFDLSCNRATSEWMDWNWSDWENVQHFLEQERSE
jgi:hypothetical protein